MLESNLFWHIVESASSMIELFVIKKIFDLTSNNKKSPKKLNLLLLGILVLVIALQYLKLGPEYRVIIVIISTIIFYKSGYKVKLGQAIMVSCIYWMLVLEMETVGASLVMFINGILQTNEVLNRNLFRLEVILISKLGLVVIGFLYEKMAYKMDIKEEDIAYICMPVLVNISLIFLAFQYFFKMGITKRISNLLFFIISLLLFLSGISVILSLIKMNKMNRLTLEKNTIENNMNMQYRYYMSIKDSQEKIKELHHDIKNHIICIKKMSEQKCNVTDYIDNIENKLLDCENIFDTGNDILNIILKEKKEICEEHGISFDSRINFTQCSFIEDSDVCSIFSNIIDNAIEACKKVEGKSRKIVLIGGVRKRFFILNEENTKSNKINISNDRIITDKEDKFLHGIGITSIRNSVEKYEGEVDIEHSDDKFIMNIIIPLQIEKESDTHYI